MATTKPRVEKLYEQTEFLMDVLSARISYGEKWIRERMKEQ